MDSETEQTSSASSLYEDDDEQPETTGTAGASAAAEGVDTYIDTWDDDEYLSPNRAFLNKVQQYGTSTYYFRIDYCACRVKNPDKAALEKRSNLFTLFVETNATLDGLKGNIQSREDLGTKDKNNICHFIDTVATEMSQ